MKSQLLLFANTVFNNGPRLTQLAYGDGSEVPETIQLESIDNDNLSIIITAFGEEEKFFFPAEILGHTTYRILGVPTFPHKVGIKPLSKEPRIIEISDLLSPEEADHFYSIAKKLEKQESMVGSHSSVAAKSLKARNSSHTWMGRESGKRGRWHSDDIVDRVEDRIFELVRLDTNTSEPFQVVFYQKDQYYYGHHDYTNKETAVDNSYFQYGGNRLVTILLYLNNVDEGGETAFPFTDEKGNPINRHIFPNDLYDGPTACTIGGLRVKPKSGGAVVFYSLKEEGHMDGIPDPFSLHAGCKVLSGEKYVSNKWIRNKRVNGRLYDNDW
jgi:hypothetical protein